MRVASNVGNLPSKSGYARSLGFRIIRHVYATDGRTYRQMDKSSAYCPLPYGRGHNKTVYSTCNDLQRSLDSLISNFILHTKKVKQEILQCEAQQTMNVMDFESDFESDGFLVILHKSESDGFADPFSNGFGFDFRFEF